MLLILQILGVLSCDLLDLPAGIGYFSPTYDQTYKIEASGQFYAPHEPVLWLFEVFEDSWFRMTIEPKYFTLHVIFSTPSLEVVSKSVPSSDFGHFSSKVQPGIYTIQLDPDAVEEVFSDNLGCDKPYVFFNIALVPLASIPKQKTLQKDHFGMSEFSGFEKFLEFNSFSLEDQNINLKTSSFKNFIYSYNFSLTVPTSEQKIVGITGLWKVFFSITHDFLTFGGLRVVISKEKKNLDFSLENPCKTGCVFAKRDQKNALNLNGVMSPGDYKISIYYSSSSLDKELFKLIGEKVVVSLFASFVPLAEKEDRVNCKAGILPSDLDNDGISYGGHIRFLDHLVVDFSADVQQTKFRISEESVIRIVTEQNSGLSIKVQLKDSMFKVVEESKVNHETNYLVSVIDPGTYYITLSEAGSISDETNIKFCDTFLLQIGVSPRESIKELARESLSCDSHETLEKIFEGIEEKLKEDERVEISPEKVFRLEHPKEHEVVFHSQVTFPSLAFVYFELFSDFTANDLVIILSDRKEELLHSTGHTYIQGTIKPGTYGFNILLRSPIEGVKKTNCVSFNLNIKIVSTTKKSLEKWKCAEKFTYHLPSTLNTLDKLGEKGTKQELLPIATMFSKVLLAPDSNLDAYDRTKFSVQTESFLKVLTESLDGSMKIVLKSGSQVIASDEKQSSEFPLIFSLSSTLNPSKEYELQIYYYPKDEDLCHTYTLSLEIYPFIETETCKVNDPSYSIFSHRTVDSENFNFMDDLGFAPADPKFTYVRSAVRFDKTISLEITDEFAMVSGHLISNNFGMTIEIFQESNLVEWGEFDASHRYQLKPTKLSKGDYSVVLKDLFTSSVEECVHISLSILIESFSYTDNPVNLMRKTETCSFPELPSSLNQFGLLEANRVHYHQKIDADFYTQYISFDLKEKSLFRTFIKPKQFRNIKIEVKDESKSESIIKTKVVDLTDGFHFYLEKGSYLLILSNSQETYVSNQCDFIEVDIEIVPEQEVKQLSSLFNCKDSVHLSDLASLENTCFIFDSSKISNSIPFTLKETSEVSIYLSYSNILSGYLSMIISDDNNENIAESIGGENIAQIKASLDPGKYYLDLISSSSDKISHPCWPLLIAYSVDGSSEGCTAGPVPSRLISKYGGPQSQDGSVSFQGKFKVRSNPDIIFIENPKNSIARLSAVSHSPEVVIEFIVYKDAKLEKKFGYSQANLDRVSLVLNLHPSNDGYYVVVTYITQSKKPCLTFDLKIQIETLSNIRNSLECSSGTGLLPSLKYELSKASEYSQDNLVILGSWIRGEDSTEGVVSSESRLKYTMTLNILQKGVLSVQVLHDFLTNLLSLKLFNSDKEVVSSHWEIVAKQKSHDKFNFAAIIAGAVVEPGKYSLVLNTGLSNKLLIETFSDTFLCFPFSFNLEFVPFDSSKNQVVLVTPNEIKKHKFDEDLVIKLTFRDRVTSADVYLVDKSDDKVKASKTRKGDMGNVLIVEFWGNKLKNGVCYKLQIDGDVDMYRQVHEYCIVGCDCSENGICNQKLECVCNELYTGDKCDECVEGYQMVELKCVSVEEGSSSYYLMFFVYIGIFAVLFYLIKSLRKRANPENGGYEMASRRDPSGEINLYSD